MDNKMQFIGNLQVYAKPFASLYYNDEVQCPVVFVRISGIKDEFVKYAAKKITFEWLEKYMRKRAGLRTIFRNGADFIAHTDHNKVLSIDMCNTIPANTFRSQERFNPEFCSDEPQILCFIKSKMK